MSCEIIRERERVEEIYWTVDFDDGYGNGFTFPANENGTVAIDKMADCAVDNYNWCLQHPERFERFNKLLKHKYSYMQPALARCICGEEFELVDRYMGSCECPNCRRIFNLYGQELKPYEYWEDDY